MCGHWKFKYFGHKVGQVKERYFELSWGEVVEPLDIWFYKSSYQTKKRDISKDGTDSVKEYMELWSVTFEKAKKKGELEADDPLREQLKKKNTKLEWLQTVPL